MLKYWLLTMLFVAGMASANDSGLYYDELRNGEGILLLRNQDTFVFYFFTYGAHQCDYEVSSGTANAPQSISEEDCDYNGQRWFYAVVEPDEEEETPSQSVKNDDKEFGGTLYMTQGINYPDGEPNDLIPFVHNVGENIAVGTFLMRREGDGWLMDVAPTEDVLEADDPLFDRIFIFKTHLFDVDETGLGPK